MTTPTLTTLTAELAGLDYGDVDDRWRGSRLMAAAARLGQLDDELVIGEPVGTVPGAWRRSRELRSGEVLTFAKVVRVNEVTATLLRSDGTTVRVELELIDRAAVRCAGLLTDAEVADELELLAPPAEPVEEAPLVVIPCGGRKLDHAAPARDLYVGSYFRSALAAALAITTPDRVRILSARYGFLGLDELVEPYELRIDAPGAVDASELAGTADDELAAADEVLVLAGKAYAQAARNVLGPAVTVPEAITNARGIGDHLATFAALAA